MTAQPPSDPVTEAVTPAVLAAALGAWRVRHHGSIGPGPAFKEAIAAGMAVALAPLLADIAALRTRAEEARFQGKQASSAAFAAEAACDTLAADLAESRAEVARLRESDPFEFLRTIQRSTHLPDKYRDAAALRFSGAVSLRRVFETEREASHG